MIICASLLPLSLLFSRGCEQSREDSSVTQILDDNLCFSSSSCTLLPLSLLFSRGCEESWEDSSVSRCRSTKSQELHLVQQYELQFGQQLSLMDPVCYLSFLVVWYRGCTCSRRCKLSQSSWCNWQRGRSLLPKKPL